MFVFVNLRNPGSELPICRLKIAGQLSRSYLVTGCAGFICSRVTELLLADGCQVTGVDNLNEAYDVRLKEWRLKRLEDWPEFTFVRLDICDRNSLKELSRTRFDAVINLAARAGVRQSVDNPWAYVDTNVTGTLNVLEMCREAGIAKLVQASTSSVYGADNPTPYREDAYADGVLSPYAASKKAAENLCHAYYHLHGLDITVPRYFTVYGSAGRPDMSVFRFIQWIAEERPVTVYGDGEYSRDFTYVDDISRGTIAALKPVGFEIVNLGSDKPYTVNQLIRMLEELLDQEAVVDNRRPLPSDVPRTWADIGKAERLLGWKPETTFQQGLTEAVRWYRDNREWAKDVVTD